MPLSNKFTKIYIKNIFLMVFILSGIVSAQFSDIKVSYEYNENQIKDDEIYILDEFTSLIKKYYDITGFSYEHNNLNIPLKIHFIFEKIFFNGEKNYNGLACQFIISNSNDQYYYIKNTKFPFRKGQTIYLNETVYNPLTSIFDFYAFLFIGYELDSYELYLGDYFYSKAMEISSMSNSDNGWDLRLEKIKQIKNNEYLRISRHSFYKCIDILNTQEYNINIVHELTKQFIDNLKLVHNRIGYDKNTLKFIDIFKNKIIDLLIMFSLDDDIIFLYNYDDKNKLFYKQHLKIDEN